MAEVNGDAETVASSELFSGLPPKLNGFREGQGPNPSASPLLSGELLPETKGDGHWEIVGSTSTIKPTISFSDYQAYIHDLVSISDEHARIYSLLTSKR